MLNGVGCGDAYKAFFRRVKAGTAAPGFPKFRGRDYWDSFGFSQNGGFRFDGRRLRLKGMPGGLRLHLHRPLPGDIGTLGHRSGNLRSITLTRDPGGRKWWANIACQVVPPTRCQSACPASTPVGQKRRVEEGRIYGPSSPVEERRWDNTPSR